MHRCLIAVLIVCVAWPAAHAKASDEVLIGVHYSTGILDPFLRATGLTNSNDIAAAAQDLAGYINDHGGLGGRPLRIVTHRSEPSIGDTDDPSAQAACEHLTFDRNVFAVVSQAVTLSTVLPVCLSTRGTPLIWQHLVALDDAAVDRFSAYL